MFHFVGTGFQIGRAFAVFYQQEQARTDMQAQTVRFAHYHLGLLHPFGASLPRFGECPIVAFYPKYLLCSSLQHEWAVFRSVGCFFGNFEIPDEWMCVATVKKTIASADGFNFNGYNSVRGGKMTDKCPEESRLSDVAACTANDE
jgi:hypothetical protein